MNLIRSKNHKVIDSDFIAIVYSEHMFLELLEILKKMDICKWNADYEYFYETVYCLHRIDKYKTQYDALQHAIEEEKYAQYEEEQYEHRWELYESYRWDRYDRW